MADVRSHQGNIYELAQPVQPVRGGKTVMDYALAAAQISESKQRNKESEARINKMSKGGGDEEKMPIGNIGGPQRLVGPGGGGGNSAPSRMEQIKTEKAELEFNDYKALREASNKSLDEFEQKLSNVDPQTLLDYRQHKENLRRTIIDNDRLDFKNTVDKQAALGDLSLFADSMVQNSNNPNIYNAFRPIFKSLDPNAPDKYNRAYLAAGIAQAAPMSKMIQQDPNNLSLIAGARQRHVNGLLQGLQSDIGKQFGDLVTLSQVPGQLGQYGQNVMMNAVNASIKNTLQKQAANAPTGYRYADEQQSTLEPIPGGPASKENASDAARFQLLNQAESLLPEIENLIFTKDGKLNKGNIATSNAPIKIGRGRELSRMMDMGISNIVYSLSGVAVRPEERQNYRNQFMPSPLDREDTVRNKFRDYTNFVMGAKQRIQTGRQVLQQPNANTSAAVNPQTQQKIKQLKYERDRGISEGRDVTMINEWYKQELNKLTGGQ